MTRDISFDALKGIAIIFVVYLHIAGIGNGPDANSFNLYSTVVLRQFANFAVPLFLFISGYFMTKKDIINTNEYFMYLFKQLPRVLIPFFLWSLIYLLPRVLDGENLKALIIRMITFSASFHLYYILAICQYYILMPLLKKYLATRKGLFFSFTVSALSCLVIEYLRYEKDIILPLFIYGGAFTTWLVFPVLGMYFAKEKPVINQKTILLLNAIAFFLSVFVTIYLISKYNDPSSAASAVKVSSFLFSSFFITFLFLNKHYLSHQKLLAQIGELSFGIYLCHLLVVSPLLSFVTGMTPVSVFSSVLVQILLTISVVCICTVFGIITRLINKKISVKYFGY